MKIRVAALLAIALMFGSVRQTGEAFQAESVEEQIRGLERAWLEAEGRRDSRALDRLIADDFIGTGPGGNILEKQDIVPRDTDEAAPGSNPWAKAALGPITVRLFGETALVMGRIHMSGSTGAGVRFTKVYMTRQGQWRLVAAHLERTQTR